MKALVVYYSKSGNNAYLAQKIAKSMQADIEKITPIINAFPVVMILSMLKAGTGIRKLRNDITQIRRKYHQGKFQKGKAKKTLGIIGETAQTITVPVRSMDEYMKLVDEEA